MDRSKVIYLISEQFEPDLMNIYEPSEVKRKVFAQVDSVTGREWFEGGRNGLNPELRIRMFRPDYNGEQILEYNSVRYEIYRTYETRDDGIDLYVQRRVGNG